MEAIPDKERAIGFLRAARQSALALRETLGEAEHDRFEGWYDGERIFGLRPMRERIDRAISDLGGGPP